MKTKLFIFLILTSMLVSCSEPGTSKRLLIGDEYNLPDNLKGLEVYGVRTNDEGYVKVAILNNQINSLTYTSGKTSSSVIVLNEKPTNQRVIDGEILSETDSIVVIKKR